MPRHDDRDHDRDRYGSNARLYVGHLSSRTRSRDLEHIFSKYGRFLSVYASSGGHWWEGELCLTWWSMFKSRTKCQAPQHLSFDGLTVSGNHFCRVRDVDLKRDYAFVEYSNPRDADDAKYHLDGRDVDGRRITVEFAKGVPRGPGGVRESAGRGPTPGSGRCFNCGLDGHWARDCTAGDWKNKCYRCGDRGHIERNCQNSPKKPRRERSYSRSPMRSRSPRRGRSRSFSKSRSYSRSMSPHKRGRDVEYDERRLMSPIGVSPEPKRHASPSKSRKHSSTPVRDNPRERGSRSPRKGEDETGQDGYSNSPRESPSPRRGRREREEDGYSDSPKETSGSPLSPATTRDEAVNGNNRSPSPITRDDGSPVNDDDDNARRTPRGSRSP